MCSKFSGLKRITRVASSNWVLTSMGWGVQRGGGGGQASQVSPPVIFSFLFFFSISLFFRVLFHLFWCF